MTEAERIKNQPARYGRVAYEKAKSKDCAFIVIDDSIYRIAADGTKHKIEDLPATRVKVQQKTFVIK